MTGKADQGIHQRYKLFDDPAIRIEVKLQQACRWQTLPVPPLDRLGQAIDHIKIKPERFAYITHGTARPIGCDACRQGGTLAAIIVIDVLDDLFTAFVLEVYIDVRRLITLFGDKALEQ